MSYANARAAMNQYSKMAVHTGVGTASPHKLIQMLMDGALEKISKAKGHMLRNEVQHKGKQISWAISIVNGLRASLDKSAGGELAQHLDDLYEYMERRLMQANLDNSMEMLDEVAGLIKQIKSAWDAIPADVQESHAQGQLPGQTLVPGE